MAHLRNRFASLFSGSNLTGTPVFVGDMHNLTFSITSSNASTSRWTFVGSNDDGLQTALSTPSPTASSGGWSIITAIVQQGLYGINEVPAPGQGGIIGFRWLNAFRSTYDASATSNVTIVVAGRE